MGQVIFGGFARKLALNKAAGVLEQKGKDFEAGKVEPMNPKLVAWLEGAGWAFAGAALGAFASSLETGSMVDQKAAYHALGLGLVALAGYVRKNQDL